MILASLQKKYKIFGSDSTAPYSSRIVSESLSFNWKVVFEKNYKLQTFHWLYLRRQIFVLRTFRTRRIAELNGAKSFNFVKYIMALSDKFSFASLVVCYVFYPLVM
jgi:hypothetical protein